MAIRQELRNGYSITKCPCGPRWAIWSPSGVPYTTCDSYGEAYELASHLTAYTEDTRAEEIAEAQAYGRVAGEEY